TADVATRTRTPAVTVVAPNFLRSHSYLFFLYPSHYHRDLHSFPTRRSSDLVRYMAEARDLRLAPDVAREAKHRILDTLAAMVSRSEEHTSELQSHLNLVCRLLLEKKKYPLLYKMAHDDCRRRSRRRGSTHTT